MIPEAGTHNLWVEDGDGFPADQTMGRGPQPYKGNIFVADMNSGLWVLRLAEPERLVP